MVTSIVDPRDLFTSEELDLIKTRGIKISKTSLLFYVKDQLRKECRLLDIKDKKCQIKSASK